MKRKNPFKLTAFNHGSAESTKCAEKKGYFLTTSNKSKRYRSDRNIDSEIFPQIECSSSGMEDENEIQTTEPSLHLPSQQCTQSTKNKSTQCKVSRKSTYVQASVNTKTNTPKYIFESEHFVLQVCKLLN